MSKFTPGPWKVSESGNKDFLLCVIASDGGSVCHVTNWSSNESNAQLIAIAPEMYALLKRLDDNETVLQEDIGELLTKIDGSDDGQ